MFRYRGELMNRKLLYVVGIGPGKPEGMTKEAKAALDDSELLVGYPLYLSLLGTEYDKKEKKSTGMTAEMERCRMALSEADSGRTVALICSGDPGIYGMAGPVLSLSGAYPEVKIRIIPGVTAATGGAALLGAPLMHDFAVISLSDRLTPWDKIEKRLRAAAEADLVIVLYNPESKGRSGYLKKACGILLDILPPERAAGTAERVGREGETCWTGTLAGLSERQADMFTTVYIGNSTTEIKEGRMITDRGYRPDEE